MRAAQRTVAIGAVAILALACGESKTATPVASDAPAGKVVQIEGDVKATRGDPPQTRPLALDSQVYGDDSVETANGALVAVLLSHNNARWQLDGGRTRRIDKTAAWRAPKGSTDDALLANKRNEDRTMVAGRHGERTAGETAETVARTAPAAAPANEPERAVSKRSQRPKRKAGTARKASKRSFGGAPKGAPKGGGGGTQLNAQERRPAGTSAAPPPPGGGRTPSPVKVPDADEAAGPDDDARKKDETKVVTITGSGRAGARLKKKSFKVVLTPSSVVQHAVKTCYKLHGKSAKGDLRVVIKVSSGGTITSATATSPATGLKGVRSCVEKKLKNRNVTKPKKAGRQTFNLNFK